MGFANRQKLAAKIYPQSPGKSMWPFFS